MSKAPKVLLPQIATANHLAGGHVVFRDENGEWSADVKRAELTRTPEEAALLLRKAEADVEARIVVDAYLIDVNDEGGMVRPAKLREAIRAQGPTVDWPGRDRQEV